MWLYGRWSDVEEAKGLMSNFIWWSKIIHAFYNKIERAAPSEILGKRTIVLHGNRLAKRFHVDKSSKYAIKGKLTKILDS